MDEGTPGVYWTTEAPRRPPRTHDMTVFNHHCTGSAPSFIRPFPSVPRVASYSPATAIEAARSDLERAVRRGEGFGVIVGRPGTGKSLLLALLAERLRGDFDVALLAGARICTRRALWQSILAELGEPYRGMEEGDLRMAIVERVRTLASSASGLVLLLDEAHTLPERLLEEIRLLSGLPTPIPAVHVVFAGTIDLEERLASPRCESLVQRIAVRCSLGRLDHAETAAYVRTQCAVASINWNERFTDGCEDAVFTISDGIPRVINQICDRALRMVEERRGADSTINRVTPQDIEAAWRRIQQLPLPGADHVPLRISEDDVGFEIVRGRDSIGPKGEGDSSMHDRSLSPATDDVVEFGMLDENAWLRRDPGCQSHSLQGCGIGHEPSVYQATAANDDALPNGSSTAGSVDDLLAGPDVEVLFDAAADPFQEMFDSEEKVSSRLIVRGPDDFATCPKVASEEGVLMARCIDAWQASQAATTTPVTMNPGHASDRNGKPADELDDRDLFIVEDDEMPYGSAEPLVFAVRPSDYRSLFARLRRGG